MALLMLELIRKLKDKKELSACDPSLLFQEICKIETCKEFSRLEQEDARELLSGLLTHWSESGKRTKKLSDLFEGWLISKIRCPECNISSFDMKPWNMISL